MGDGGEWDSLLEKLLFSVSTVSMLIVVCSGNIWLARSHWLTWGKNMLCIFCERLPVFRHLEDLVTSLFLEQEPLRRVVRWQADDKLCFVTLCWLMSCVSYQTTVVKSLEKSLYIIALSCALNWMWVHLWLIKRFSKNGTKCALFCWGGWVVMGVAV